MGDATDTATEEEQEKINDCAEWLEEQLIRYSMVNDLSPAIVITALAKIMVHVSIKKGMSVTDMLNGFADIIGDVTIQAVVDTVSVNTNDRGVS